MTTEEMSIQESAPETTQKTLDDLEKLQDLAKNERDNLNGKPASAMKLSELQTMPSRQYLDETVMPLLSTGLERLIEERPPNPVDWLATFLLKNKDQAPYTSK